jgi:cobalt-zinc-cadmium efflux system membrane fusion protein
MKLSLPFLSLLMILFLSLLSCSEPQSTETTASEPSDQLSISSEKIKQMNIQVSPLDSQSIQPKILANGVIRLLPDDQAEVSALISGNVAEFLCKEGQNVQKGQVILKLISTEFIELQKEYRTAQIESQGLKMEYDRQQQLQQAGVNALKEFQQASNRYHTAKIQVETLAEKLKLLGISPEEVEKNMLSGLSIKSPISGQLTSLPLKLGQYITPGTALASVNRMDVSHADLFVFTKDAPFLKQGQTVRLKSPASTIPLTGSIKYINQEMDVTQQTLKVHVKFTAGKETLYPEMPVQGEILGTLETQLAIPNRAILYAAQGTVIFIQTSEDTAHHFQLIPVTLGAKDADYVTLLSPQLPVGTQVVVEGGNWLLGERNREKE